MVPYGKVLTGPKLCCSRQTPAASASFMPVMSIFCSTRRD
jgi:hypothetical protein